MRAVAPWTWRIALRDHGPRDVRFLAAMLTLATYMDRSGFAWPGLRAWARGARINRRTLARIVDEAIVDGWLGVAETRRDGQAWRGRVYRCAVPEGLRLGEKGEELADVYSAQLGEPEDGREGGASIAHHVIDKGGAPMHAPRSDAGSTEKPQGGALRPLDVVHSEPEGGALSGVRGASRVHQNSSSNSVRNSKEEAPAIASAGLSETPAPRSRLPSLRPKPTKADDSQEARDERIRAAITKLPEAQDDAIAALVANAKSEDVKRIREALASPGGAP